MPLLGSIRFCERLGRVGAAAVVLALCSSVSAVRAAAPPAPAVAPIGEPQISPLVPHARELADRGNVAGAIAVLAPYVAANPRDVDAGRYLGDLYLLARDAASAERAYLAVLTVDASDRDTHFRLGNLYSSQDRLDEAVAQYERTLPDVAAFADLVRVHRRLGDLDEFVESYRIAARDRSDIEAQFAYGVVLEEIHQPANAVPFLELVVKKNPRSCSALTELGVALVDVDKTARAEDLFHACLAQDQDDYGALVDLASAEAGDRADEARGFLEHAIAVHPNAPEAFVNLGYLDDMIGNHDSATAHYEHAIELDPFCRAAYVDLGYDQLQGGMFAVAETTLLRGLSVSNGDGRIEYMLAKMFEHQGKADLARREFKNATQSDEPDVAAAATAELRRPL